MSPRDLALLFCGALIGIVALAVAHALTEPQPTVYAPALSLGLATEREAMLKAARQ